MNKEIKSDSWLSYGDWVRVLGTFAVVLTHCIDFKLYNKETYDMHRTEWWVANCINAATRWAVPVYIMLSGAIMLAPNKEEPISVFYKKRLSRVGLPLLIWVPFFVWFGLYVTHWSDKNIVIDQILHGEPYGHLHFVVRILGLYAFTPMLRVFTTHAPRSMLLYTIFLTLGIGAANSCIDAFTDGRASAAMRFVPFIGFYLAGYYLRDIQLTPSQKIWTWFAFFGSIISIILFTGLMVPKYGLKWYPSIPFMFYDFLSLPRIILGIAAWLLLVDFCKNLKKPKFLTTIAAATLGVYIIHPIFKDIAVVYKIWTPEQALFPSFFIYYIGVYVCSLITILLLLRIPFLKRVVG